MALAADVSFSTCGRELDSNWDARLVVRLDGSTGVSFSGSFAGFWAVVSDPPCVTSCVSGSFSITSGTVSGNVSEPSSIVG